MQHYTTTIDKAGRIVIPAAQRKALGLKAGDTINISIQDDELRLITIEAAINRLQEYCKDSIPPGVSLADELIAERRAEAEREEQE